MCSTSFHDTTLASAEAFELRTVDSYSVLGARGATITRGRCFICGRWLARRATIGRVVLGAEECARRRRLLVTPRDCRATVIGLPPPVRPAPRLPAAAADEWDREEPTRPMPAGWNPAQVTA